jgi:acetylornithine deacetylase/succinyl-diaminopimelate desuccinylase-like protein
VVADELHNVSGLLPGAHRDAPALLVSAHTDTVFSEGTDLGTRSEGATLYGPGLGDNSLGVASLLALAMILRQQNITPSCDVWFVATSCEEGLET